MADYFALKNGLAESANDTDLGSGGIMLLPDLTDATGTVQHLAVGAGKDGNMYVVSRDSLGKFSATANNIWQELDGSAERRRLVDGRLVQRLHLLRAHGRYPAFVFGSQRPAFRLSRIADRDHVSAIRGHRRWCPRMAPRTRSSGVREQCDGCVLHAYDATNLTHELYNSNQAANNRDQFGAGNKFIARRWRTARCSSRPRTVSGYSGYCNDPRPVQRQQQCDDRPRPEGRKPPSPGRAIAPAEPRSLLPGPQSDLRS